MPFDQHFGKLILNLILRQIEAFKNKKIGTKILAKNADLFGQLIAK